MADNIDVTPGSGKTVRADEVGATLLQVIKIGLGADGAEDLLLDSGQQTMANSLPAVIASDQTPIPAGKKLKNCTSTPTISGTIYDANDCVGGKLTLTDAMRVSAGQGRLHSLHIIDRGNQKAAFVVQIYNADPSAATLTDHSAIVYSTDLAKVICTFLVTAADYNTAGAISFADVIIDLDVAAVGSAHLYASVMAVGAPDYATTTDLTFDFAFEQW